MARNAENTNTLLLAVKYFGKHFSQTRELCAHGNRVLWRETGYE